MRKYSPREEVMIGRGPIDTGKDYANLWWTSIEQPTSIPQPLVVPGGGHLIKVWLYLFYLEFFKMPHHNTPNYPIAIPSRGD